MERTVNRARRTAAGRPAGVPASATNWLEIDRAAFAHNVRAFVRRLAPQARLAAVVKSNAYGHGVDLLAPVALAEGVSMLAVGSIDEALALRRLVGPDVEILVLGWVPAAAYPDAVRHDVQLTVYDREQVRALSEAARIARRSARIHVKLETGTHRQGADEREALALADEASRSDWLQVAGLSTHFADIEDTTEHAFARRQLDRFQRFARKMAGRGHDAVRRHIACSAAAILFPETHFDFARAGIGLYGLWPSSETRVSAAERGALDLDLRPVMSWKASIAQVKQIPVGAFVGYGRTWRATRPSRIAILPVGYYEGYDRSISGRGHVLVRGVRAPVVGRICMNMMMVDITDVPGVSAGETVTLLGRCGDERIRAEDLAAWAATIHYEIVSRIHPGVPRIAID